MKKMSVCDIISHFDEIGITDIDIKTKINNIKSRCNIMKNKYNYISDTISEFIQMIKKDKIKDINIRRINNRFKIVSIQFNKEFNSFIDMIDDSESHYFIFLMDDRLTSIMKTFKKLEFILIKLSDILIKFTK